MTVVPCRGLDVIVAPDPVRGGLSLSCMHDGRRHHCVFYFYDEDEAVERFAASVLKGTND